MPLESTVICLDNSEWMRNGDYVPTRLAAQQDAANLICTARCDQNPENTVGILAMAGSGVELLVSPTDEIGKLLAAFARVQIEGSMDFAAAVQIAQLALKHRRNKNGGQRIIVFVGSPIDADAKTLEKIGKQLKKNNVAVDVVSMGELDVNHQKLEAFITAANSNDNSHLIAVPPGVLPSEAIISSPILQDGADMGMGAARTQAAADGGASGFAEYGGVDPSLDPELAMALRLSAEEARADEEARARSQAAQGPTATATATTAVSESKTSDPVEDMDEMLQQALALSMQDYTTQAQPTAEVSAPSAEISQPMEEDDDPALRMALELSMNAEAEAEAAAKASAPAPAPTTAPAPAPSSSKTEEAAPFIDLAFVREMLGGVDGVDLNDPIVLAALAQVTGQAQPKPDEAKDKGADEKKSKGGADEKKDEKK